MCPEATHDQQLIDKRAENSKKMNFEVKEIEWQFADYFFKKARAADPGLNKLDKDRFKGDALQPGTPDYQIIEEFCSDNMIPINEFIADLDHSFYYDKDKDDIIATKGKHHYKEEQINQLRHSLEDKFTQDPPTKPNQSDKLIVALKKYMLPGHYSDPNELQGYLDSAYESLGVDVSVEREWESLGRDFDISVERLLEQRSIFNEQFAVGVDHFTQHPEQISKDILLNFINLSQKQYPEIEIDESLIENMDFDAIIESILEQKDEIEANQNTVVINLQNTLDDIMADESLQTSENLKQFIEDVYNVTGQELSSIKPYKKIAEDLITEIEKANEPKIYYSWEEIEEEINQEITKQFADDEKVIPHGAFAKFRQGISRNTGDVIGLRIEGVTEEGLPSARQEAELTKLGLGEVSHLERQLGEEKEFLYNQASAKSITVMKFIEGQPLTSFLNDKSDYSDEQLLTVGLNLCEALQKMQAKGLVHFDLKPDNIIIDKDLNITIIDYGLAEKRDNDEYVKSNMKGTLHYIAPEVRNYGVTGSKTDNWAMAIILAELIGIENDTLAKLKSNHLHAFRVDDLKLKEGSLAPSIDEFLNNCFEKDPKKRPDMQSMAEAFQNAILQEQALAASESSQHSLTTSDGASVVQQASAASNETSYSPPEDSHKGRPSAVSFSQQSSRTERKQQSESTPELPPTQQPKEVEEVSKPSGKSTKNRG